MISLGAIINYPSRNALGVLAPKLKDGMGIVGAAALIVPIGGERHVDRFAAA